MPTRIKNLSAATVVFSIALLSGSDAIAQRGSSSIRRGISSGGTSIGSRGISGIGRSSGISRGTSSIGRSTSSIRGTVTRPPSVGGIVSGRTRLQSSGTNRTGITTRSNTTRRVPNSVSRIPSLNQRYSSSYSNRNRRIGGTSVGLFIGTTPRYGIGGYTNYGSPYYSYGYNNLYATPRVNTVIVPQTGLNYQQQFGTTVIPQVQNVPLAGNNIAPVNQAPAQLQPIAEPPVAQSPVATTVTSNRGRSLPRNIIPASSLLTEGAPDISEAGKAVLYNPSQSGGSVTYQLNGNEYTIRPGEAQGVELNKTWKLQFHRGLNDENASYTLSEGIHKFRVGNGGWEVVRTQKTTVEAQKQADLPAPPAPVEGPSIEPAPQTQTLPEASLETIQKVEKPAAESQITDPALQTPTDLPPGGATETP